ncbi:hypothetical protein [Aeromonas sp. sia0103]|uniref:hypothetical protein n=1 Tax=Aeromonas sp. sia0103 TaxID=2854782 RepID=UPI000FC3C43F|nr:hypothetical protein [Aeromonas sp. sia0103]
MMFNAMLSALCRHLALPQEGLHKDGLDLPVGPFSLHIRQQDELVTLFIPLGKIPVVSLAAMADWPVLQLSRSGEQDALLWSREWLDKLDVEILVDLISRMLHQAETLAHPLPAPPAVSASGGQQGIRG